MLRKDVRFGLTIGGVLVAVLVVYVLVLSRGGSKPTLTDVTLVTSGDSNGTNPAAGQPPANSPGVTLTETGAAPANSNSASASPTPDAGAQPPTNGNNASANNASPGASGSTASPDFTSAAPTASANSASPVGSSSPGGAATSVAASPAGSSTPTAADDKWATALATGMLDATDNTPRTASNNADTSAISFTQTPSNLGASPVPRPQFASAADPSNSASANNASASTATPSTPSPTNDSSTGGSSGNASSGSASSSTPSPKNDSSGNDSNSNPDASASTPAPDADAASADSSASANSNTAGASADSTAKRTHKIASGETLSSISTAAYGNPRYWKQIAAANPGLNPNVLHPGTVIVLPAIARSTKSHDASPTNAAPSDTANAASNSASDSGTASSVAASTLTPAQALAAGAYKVQPGDSLYKIAKKLYHDGAMADAIYQLNKDEIGSNPAKLKAGQTLKLPAPKNAAS